MKVKIGDKLVGDDEPCFVTADIGINHNGSLDLAKQLIGKAFIGGCDAVKFQKRTIESVYSKEELEKPRESPFGTTNGDLKRGLELNYEDYQDIDCYCKQIGILWFASCWDKKSVDLIDRFNPPCYKIASPCLTDDALLYHTKSKGKPIILSTGMSTLKQIDHAVDILGRNNLVILHCTSTYPGKIEELNLKVIHALWERYRVPIGYSGHEVGIATTIAAAVLGARMVERHITLDRSMWGTDQAASVEPQGMERIVRYIHTNEKSMGDGFKKIYDSEIPIMKKLRKCI
jgi:N-acetylneuraminate synthase